jgi:hypothetical protein
MTFRDGLRLGPDRPPTSPSRSKHGRPDFRHNPGVEHWQLLEAAEMAVQPTPSDVLKQAADIVAAGPHRAVQVTAYGREIPADPIVESLRSAASMYAPEDRRGWTVAQVRQRVGPADRVALRFARALLDPQHQPDAGSGTSTSLALAQGLV